MKRREFIKQSTLIAGGLLLGGTLPTCDDSHNIYTLRVMTAGISSNYAHSTDWGTSWTTSNIGITSINGLAVDSSDRWMGVGNFAGGIAAYSTDSGLTWTTSTISGSNTFRRVATDNKGRWVTVGTSSGGTGMYAYSTDGGVNWTSGSILGTPGMWGLATDGSGTWIGNGGTYIIYSHDNGINWSTVNLSAYWTLGEGRQVATDGQGRWVFVGSQKTGVSCGYSTDNGVTWSLSDTGIFFNTGLATDSQGRWVTVGYDSSGNGTAAYSTDGGAKWTMVSIPALTGFSLNYVATDGAGRWIAVGGSGAVVYSNDGGVTWTTGSTGIGSNLFAVAISFKSS